MRLLSRLVLHLFAQILEPVQELPFSSSGLSSWAVSPALAQQTIAFPVSAPPECTELAQCENVPTLIENKYQAALARIKLARLSGAEPIVAQCKQAVERLKAATKG